MSFVKRRYDFLVEATFTQLAISWSIIALCKGNGYPYVMTNLWNCPFLEMNSSRSHFHKASNELIHYCTVRRKWLSMRVCVMSYLRNWPFLEMSSDRSHFHTAINELVCFCTVQREWLSMCHDQSIELPISWNKQLAMNWSIIALYEGSGYPCVYVLWPIYRIGHFLTRWVIHCKSLAYS